MLAMHTVHNLPRPTQAGGMLGFILFFLHRRLLIGEIKMGKYAWDI